MKKLIVIFLIFLHSIAYGAILLNESGERYVQFKALPVTGSMSLWIYPTWAQTDGVYHNIVYSRINSSQAFWLLKWTDNALYAGWMVGGTDYRVIVASGSYTLNQNAWNHILITWDDTANVTTLYLNGTSIGTPTATLVTGTTSSTSLGSAAGSGTSASDCACYLAEFAYWTRVLESGEISTLSKKYSPAFIMNGLSHYYRLARNDSVSQYFSKYKIGDFDSRMEVSAGTLGVAEHPPMIYPR